MKVLRYVRKKPIAGKIYPRYMRATLFLALPLYNG